jgi:hypothetical protein
MVFYIYPLRPYTPNTSWAEALKNVPMWLLQGDKDTRAPLADSIDPVKALRSSCNDVQFTFNLAGGMIFLMFVTGLII